MPICTACEHENPEGARFCNQCGRRLEADDPVAAGGYTPRHLRSEVLRSPAAVEGERKQVTVLFTDVRKSTRLARQAGAEAWHEILDRLFAILAGAVHRFGGTVNQYTGDGIMALFGAPVAHEDHAARACHAALDADRAVRRYADSLRREHGLELAVRMGLNSGEVVVGAIGDALRSDYTAQGDTVNLAARMEQIARPGRIALTGATARMVTGQFEVADLGETQVAGVDEPVHVYELVGRGRALGRLERNAAGGWSRFVGRERESAQLHALRARLLAGQGGFAAVLGQAGLGKSRLCHEFLSTCEADGVRVYRTTAVPYAQAMPLFPIQQLLRSYFGIDPGETPETARERVVSQLAESSASREDAELVLGFLGLSPCDETGVAPDQRLRRLQQLCSQSMAAMADPVVVLAEDLHWADSASVEFIRHLAETTRQAPLLLLCNARAEHEVSWLREDADLVLELASLHGDAVDSLLADLLGDDATLRPLAALIRERADGNPYFVEEAVCALVESGHLRGQRGRYRAVTQVAELAIPDNVHALLAARIDRLPDRDKRVLQAASVVGREFEVRWLGAILGFPGPEIDAALRALTESDFIRPADGDATYAFRHPLMQEAVYRSQLNARRAHAHAELARAIESDAGGQPNELAPRIAHHWERAGESLAAAHWHVQAAARAGQLDLHASLDHHRRAIALADRAPDEDRARRLAIAARSGLLRMATLLDISAEEIDRVYQEARELAECCADAAGRAELAISYGSCCLHLGHADRGLSYTTEGLRLARENGEQALIGRFRIPVLLVHFGAGRLREGLEQLADSGDGHWADGPITEENFGSRAMRAIMIAYMGQLAASERELEAAWACAQRAGRPVSWILSNRVELAYLVGAASDEKARAQEAVRLAERYDSPLFREHARRAVASARLLAGEPDDAMRLLEDTLHTVAAGTPAFQFAGPHLTLLADAAVAAGEPRRAIDYAKRGIELTEAAGARLWLIGARLAWVRASLAQGRIAPGELETTLEAAERDIELTGGAYFRAPLAQARADLADGRGDRGLADAQRRHAASLYRRMGAAQRADRLATSSDDETAADRHVG